MTDAALGLMFLGKERDRLNAELESPDIQPERVDEIFARLAEIEIEENELCEDHNYQQAVTLEIIQEKGV